MTAQTPAKGCVTCHEGAKMVLFITGICRRSCWYCPLSIGRKGRDTIFANETPVNSPGEALSIARMMDALGTGVTGGEPFLVLERVILFCRELKSAFGPGHHIHLYTGEAPGRDQLSLLTGLVDEIRIHPPPDTWADIRDSPYAESVAIAREMGFSAGFEVPSLPGIEALAPVLPLLDFLNINELEWGESNADAMREKGLELSDGVHNAVKGAWEWARPLIHHPKVHFCSSRFKDSVQLRKRLIRIARNTARPFDHVTDDGTIVYGLIQNGGILPAVVQTLDEGSYEVRDGAIETFWWVVSEFAGEIAGEKSIIERYPNRGIIVEVTPVP
ncbi:MAG: radical SAM protein [Methanolinea sp.]|nr:radical SAM protein [Methanolinea sp.]